MDEESGMASCLFQIDKPKITSKKYGKHSQGKVSYSFILYFSPGLNGAD